ncbi:MAG: MMPL family transporter, partial [Actinomycetota bacterium]|nr:MMPL family transporter [Actinomycetota bacterium]
MKMFSTEGLARASARRPWITLGLWVVAIAVAGWISSQYLADALTTSADFTNTPEAVQAEELIEERFGEEGITEILILSSEDTTVDDPAFEQAVRAVQGAAIDEGGEAVTFFDTEDPSMVSEDQRTTLMPVTFEDTRNIADYLPTVEGLIETTDETGLNAQAFGPITIEEDFSHIAEEDLAQGETFGVLVALVVLVLVFGALVAGLIPIAMGVASIAVAIGLVALVGIAVDFSFFVTNMITMMGLAVGIDYSLFIVSRYREERQRGAEKLDAIAATGATASRAVFFSGLTVVLA